MDAALRELLTSDVLHAPLVTVDDYDARSYGTLRAFRARVVEEAREIRRRDGSTIVRRGYLILGEEAADMAERDQLALGGLSGGELVQILAVSKPRDIDQAIHHVRVDFL